MHTVPVSSGARTRTARAVGISLTLAMALAGCAYEYDDDFASGTPSASAPPFTDAALPRDPSTRLPVSGAELDAWLAQVLPATEGEVVHTGYGTLAAEEVRTETTAPVPSGSSYSLTLACRSPQRVSFSIGHGDLDLVDLNLRCGTSRVSVVYLPEGAVLNIEVEANAGANFAYRVSRI
ncbi:hypothetical protein [Pseudarthrobacter sp. PvP090]|uniref:hypothetical protein n=1 Tax=Pseudarthrobacter sp. PvP090 TaxID=3156393 RepID=UPI00339B1195